MERWSIGVAECWVDVAETVAGKAPFGQVQIGGFFDAY